MRPAVNRFISSRRARPRPVAKRRLLLLVFLLLAALSMWVVPAAVAGPVAPRASRRVHMDVLYSASLLHAVSKNDAVAAIRLWVETIARQRGWLMDSSISIAENLPELKKRVQEGPVTLVALDPVEYLELADLGVLEPAFTGTTDKSDGTPQFLLVANQESGATAISGLRGKTLAIQANSRADLGRMWIEILLRDGGLGPADRFFGSLSSVPTSSAAALPIFFGKLGAGVVDRASFEVMEEMNPQLGSKLLVLAASPPLLSGILCVDKRTKDNREDLLKGLRELHRTVEGKQILLVFKSSRLKPVSTEDLEQARSLYAKYRLISGKTADPKPGVPGGLHLGARP